MTLSNADHELRERLRRVTERSVGGRVSGFEEIAPGLGSRRFFRLTLAGGELDSLIARVEPSTPTPPAQPGIPPEPPLEPLLGFLAQHGLPVPRHHGGDAAAGIELLEDLGDRSLEAAARAAAPEESRQLYGAACALIPRLQRLQAEAAEIPAFGRRLDDRLIATKAEKFVAWTLPPGLGRAPSPTEREVVFRAFARIAAECDGAPQRLAHRDFKAANLHLRSGREGTKELVMIDIQGAFLAPPEYDLVCLLRDSHVPLPEPAVRAHAEQTRIDLPDAPGAEEFERRFDWLTLVRVAKDVSHYLHAARERGDTRYLAWVPTALANLRSAARRAAARDPALGELWRLIESLPPGIDVDPPTIERNEPTCGQ